MSILYNEPCPSCLEKGRDKTGNHLLVFEDGNKYCQRCEMFIPSKEKSMSSYKQETLEQVSSYPFLPIKSRGIPKVVAEHYGVRSSVDEGTGEVNAVYFPFYQGGNLIGYKKRFLAEKKFTGVGSIKEPDLFGQNQAGAPSKFLVMVEGEFDTLATKEMFRQEGKNYKVVGVPGATAHKVIQRNLEWVNAFETIALCFDQDEAGKKLTEKVIELLDPGKVKVVKISEKDPNDMLLKGKVKTFLTSISNASIARPDGIISGLDTWDILKNRPVIKCLKYPLDWEELNKKTYGIRIGELDTWTSGSGMGKTQLLKELQYHIFNNTEANIGVIALEEPITDSVEDIMSLHINKRIRLPDVKEKISEEDMYRAWKETIGTNRFHFYDHFGSVTDESLISKIKYLSRGLDCDYIFLDHLSIVVSEFAANGGERERIDSIMTKLKNLTQELNIWLGLVVHLRKNLGAGKSFEEGATPSLDDLRGSGAIKQLSNSVYALSRNQQAEDPRERNTSQIHVLKCRFTGQTGKADQLFYDVETGRMEITKPQEATEEDVF